MKNTLGGQVAVDFDASQQAANGIEHGPRRSFEDARRRICHLQLFAHAAFDSASHFPPALRKSSGFRGVIFEAPNQCVQSLEFAGLLRGQAGNLFEPRIHGADVVLSVEQDDSFLEPFDNVLQFDFGSARLPR